MDCASLFPDLPSYSDEQLHAVLAELDQQMEQVSHNDIHIGSHERDTAYDESMPDDDSVSPQQDNEENSFRNNARCPFRSTSRPVITYEKNEEGEERKTSDESRNEEKQPASHDISGAYSNPLSRMPLESENAKGKGDARRRKSDVSNKERRVERLSTHQLAECKRLFLLTPYPSVDDYKELADRLNVTKRKVLIWFRNNRAKEKRMQKKERADTSPQE
ncbi:hypothetical protein HN011_011641, partial [Eciton burchellii]